jgi:AGCS family alanine or glycine:cation symporter
MYILDFLSWLNDTVFAIPSTILFLSAGVWFSIQTGFIQIRYFKRFIHILLGGLKTEEKKVHVESHTINGFHALFTAMATSIGTGSIVAPSLAIIAGGPGALFWLILYLFFGAVTKFIEVVCALHTREIAPESNKLVGGPMHYLKLVHPWLAAWYSVIMLLLYFFGWQTVQANTLASIYAQENIPQWLVGICLALLTYWILKGGARLIGDLASKLVPFMFFMYVGFALYILSKNIPALIDACKLVISDAFHLRTIGSSAAGITLFQAMHAGVYRGIFISEAGLGTASIPHSIADTKYPHDQGILAMYATIADIILSIISGLLILVTKVWANQSTLRATLIYEAFKLDAPGIGQIVLLISISLFVFTTIIGNGFNGMQIFASFTQSKHLNFYIRSICLVIFFATLMPVPLVWQVQDLLLTLAAVPHILGLIYISIKHKKWIL